MVHGKWMGRGLLGQGLLTDRLRMQIGCWVWGGAWWLRRGGCWLGGRGGWDGCHWRWARGRRGGRHLLMVRAETIIDARAVQQAAHQLQSHYVLPGSYCQWTSNCLP